MVCKSCKENKPIDKFYIRKESGIPRKICKFCFNISRKIYRNKNKEKIKNSHHSYKRSIPGRFTSLKSLAKSKDLDCSISIEDFKKMHKEPCNYCGDNFDRKAGYGIDRIDSNIGYTKENSVACCSKCNFAKNNLEYDEFIKHILKIANHISSKY